MVGLRLQRNREEWINHINCPVAVKVSSPDHQIQHIARFKILCLGLPAIFIIENGQRKHWIRKIQSRIAILRNDGEQQVGTSAQNLSEPKSISIDAYVISHDVA